MPTFDGDNLLIRLDASTPEVNAKVDLYSDWKEWFKTGTNAKYPLAFDTTGGDPTTATGSVAAYFFLRNDNGWRIKPAEESADVVIVGNLYPRDASLPMFVKTNGGYTVLLTVERDASSVVETVGSGLSAGQDAKLTNIDDLLSTIEGTLDHREVMRLLLAVLAGKVNGAGTGTENFRDQADSKNRVVSTVDSSGNRTNVVLDAG